MENYPAEPGKLSIMVGPPKSASPNRLYNFFLGGTNHNMNTPEGNNMIIMLTEETDQINNALGLQSSQYAIENHDNMDYTETKMPNQENSQAQQ